MRLRLTACTQIAYRCGRLYSERPVFDPRRALDARWKPEPASTPSLARRGRLADESE